MDEIWTIIGLGNPGAEYAQTPHNIGREAVERIHERSGAFTTWTHTRAARYAEGALGDTPVRLVLPDTFMNTSGSAVRELGDVRPTRLIVVHDEIDLPLGTIRISHDRGAGGHNGVRSVMHALGGGDFTRVRIGVSPRHFLTGAIAKPRGSAAVSAFVLKPFSRAARAKLTALYDRAADAVEMIVSHGASAAMNEYNTRA